MQLFQHLHWWRQPRERRHWSAVAVLALLTAVVLVAAEQRTRSAISAWQPDGEVWQATRTLGPEDTIAESDIQLVEIPRHLRPLGAVTGTAPTARLRRVVAAGQILTELDFQAGAATADERLVAISAPRSGWQPAPGSSLDLVVAPQVDPYGDQPVVHQVVPARLLESSDDSWLVAVGERDAVDVALATVSGVIVALVAAG